MNGAQLLARHPILDGHNDLAIAMRELVNYDLDAYPLDVAQTKTQTDLVRLRAGGVGGQFWSVFVPSHWRGSARRTRSRRRSSRSTSCCAWSRATPTTWPWR